MDGPLDETSSNLAAGVHGQFVATESLQAGVECIVHENAIGVGTLAAHVIYAIAISSECAIPYLRTRILEDRQDTVIHERPLARIFRYDVFSGVGNVTHEQAVDDASGAAGQQVDRGSGHLGSVPEKQTVLNQHRVLIEALVLDGDAGATRTGKVVNDLHILDDRIGTTKNFDRPAVSKKEEVLGNRHVRFHLFRESLGEEIICSGNAKPL